MEVSPPRDSPELVFLSCEIGSGEENEQHITALVSVPVIPYINIFTRAFGESVIRNSLMSTS